MKKILAISAFILILCPIAFADDLDIGTHASFYLPPEGGGNTLMMGVDANYRIGSYFSARGSIDNSNYSTSDHQYSLTTYTVTLIGHILGDSNIDPYLGAGLGLYDKKTDGISNSTTGYNALAGLAFRFPAFNAGLEIKYTIPDSRHMDTGYYSIGGQMTGGLHVSF